MGKAFSQAVRDSARPPKFATDTFYFGEPEAEAEVRRERSGTTLLDFFNDYLGIYGQIFENNKFLVIGRKGSGKTAIAEFFKKKYADGKQVFCEFIRSKDINFQKISRGCDDNNVTSTAIFEWTLLLKISEMILKNEFLKSHKNYYLLKEFYDKNSGFIENLQQNIRKNSSKTDLDFTINIHAVKFGAKRESTTEHIETPFYRYIPELRRVTLEMIESSNKMHCEYCIFVDDLDINFDANNEQDVSDLASLIRTTKEYNIIYSPESHADIKIVIMIRDDILKCLDCCTADMAKITNSYGTMISWYDYETYRKSPSDLPLFKLALKRLGHSINKAFQTTLMEREIWPRFTGDRDDLSTFKRIIDIVYARPRDLIMYFSSVSTLKTSYPLSTSHLNRLERDYCTRIVPELKNELSAFYSRMNVENLFETLKLLQSRHKNGFSLENFKSACDEKCFNGDHELALQRLFDYSAIGQRVPKQESSVDDYYYKYREPREAPYHADLRGLFVLHKSLASFRHHVR